VNSYLKNNIIKVSPRDFSLTHNDWNGRMLDSYGRCGTAETPQEAHRKWVMHALRQDVVVLACLPFSRRLSARPMESEHPVVEINTFSSYFINFCVI
jgi:hypothetical protein